LHDTRFVDLPFVEFVDYYSQLTLEKALQTPNNGSNEPQKYGNFGKQIIVFIKIGSNFVPFYSLS